MSILDNIKNTVLGSTTVKPKTIIYSELPETYLKEILKYEGGYVNDPLDFGGETNRGITLGALNKAKSQGLVASTVTIKDLTNDIESVRKIYNKNYYKAGHANEMPHPLSFVHFDSCVNHGVSAGARLLQKTIVKLQPVLASEVKIDGAIGPKTMKGLKQCLDEVPLLDIVKTYNNFREQYYNDIVKNKPSQRKFLKGWMNRLTSVRKFCEAK